MEEIKTKELKSIKTRKGTKNVFSSFSCFFTSHKTKLINHFLWFGPRVDRFAQTSRRDSAPSSCSPFCLRQRHEIPQDTGMIRRILFFVVFQSSRRRSSHSHIIIYHSILVSLLPKERAKKKKKSKTLRKEKEFKNDDDEWWRTKSKFYFSYFR